MENRSVAEQTLVENKLLSYLMEALRDTIKSDVDDADFSRKLSSVRFLSQSFQRHLERLMSLEEFDGYMNLVLEQHPHMMKDVDPLREEHDKFRNGISRIVHQLDQIASNDHSRFHAICDDLEFHLDKLETHNQKEMDLIQEALDRDGGGEG